MPETPGTGGQRFGDRVGAAFAAHGRLCVGIDPHGHLLDRWDLENTADGARELGLRVVEAAHGRVGFLKPQVAFFERFGAAGFAALERVLREAREARLIVIADAKRGDIGSTNEGYADAWLKPGSPLESDAVTLSPYLGFASLRPTVDFARKHGKGVLVLAATSNPEAAAIQTARVESGGSVSTRIVDAVAGLNHSASEGRASAGEVGDVGVVLGATVDFAESRIDLGALAGPPATPILAPGFGAQGAHYRDVTRLFREAAPSVIASASRSILEAGSAGVAEAILRASEELSR
ncbi:MAG: orotidine-5'-phosphate decarboxylase [Cryobacterium sp.]|nr:orotidine-5'-phosphate decarboxylase [Cryobacterium sp.]